jgi:hypothetical protein
MDAHVYRNGDFLHGQYESTGYDAFTLIITDDEGLDDVTILCDDCTDKLVEQKKAYVTHSSLREINKGPFPAKVYSVLFEHYAHSIMNKLNKFDAGPEVREDEPDIEYIEVLRKEIRFDPSGGPRNQLSNSPFIIETEGVALAHILAAFSLGVRPDEAHIKKAAERYGAGVEKAVAADEELMRLMLAEIENI